MSEPVSTNGPTITSPIVQGGAAPPPVESPIVEGNTANNPPLDPVASPNVDPTVPPVVEPVVDPNASDVNKQVPDIVQKRINELTAKRYEAERATKIALDKAAAAEKINAELLAKLAGSTAPTPSPTAPTAPVNPAMSDEELNKLVNERAVQVAEAKKFNDSCDSVAATGKQEFPDWDDAVKNLTMVGALGNNVPLEFLQTAIELKNPAKILHHLSKNLEETGKLVKMSPTRMAVEMARIEAQVNAPAAPPPPIPVSNAPAPVIPVGGAAKPGTSSLDDPNLPATDWFALRNKEIEDKRKRYQRV